MDEIKTVYFAGKVKKGGGYRELLFQNSRVMSDGYEEYQLNGGKLIYGGPFALCCDHGCFHGEGTHGSLRAKADWCEGSYNLHDWEEHSTWDESDKPQFETQGVIKRCLDQIILSDAIHCYLETVSCYGTLAELGFASAMGKAIYIYHDSKAHRWTKHLWFAMGLPGVKCCEPGPPTSIHPDLLTKQKSYKERYYEYLESEEWNRLRLAKLQEAGYRCQLCNKANRLSVHHRTYERVFHEELSDLIALCDECHKKFHGIEDEFLAQLAS